MPNSGAGGPCDHCGRTQTCCWRRGPPSKPVLCNACGSRYLVKRSLDGYKPLQVRQNNATTGKPKPSAGMVAQEEKRKRSVLKMLDSDQLDSDSAYSEDLDYMTDDSAERTSHSRATKVVRITSAAQLKELGGADLQTLAVSLLHSSLRTKPRKPLNPTVTALF